MYFFDVYKFALFTLINLLFSTIFMAHVLSCAFLGLEMIERILGIENTWLSHISLQDASWGTKYTYSLYYNITTMTSGNSNKQNILFKNIISFFFSWIW
jgi:hypothetical protein